MKARFKELLFALLMAPIASPLWGAVTMNVGYMDEELSFLTREIANLQDRQQPLLIVENGHWQGGLLFQQALTRLLPGRDADVRIYHVSTTGVVAVKGFAPGDSIGHELAFQLKHSMQRVNEEFARLRCEQGPTSETRGDGKMTVFSLVPRTGGGLPPRDATVIVRSPEFGRQAPLVQALLRRIVRAVKGLPQASPEHGGLALASYGTGGAIAADLPVGATHKVDASVFLGYQLERESVGSPAVYRGLVTLVESDGETTTFFKTEPLASRTEAEESVRTILRSKRLGGLRPVTDHSCSGLGEITKDDGL